MKSEDGAFRTGVGDGVGAGTGVGVGRCVCPGMPRASAPSSAPHTSSMEGREAKGGGEWAGGGH